MYSENEVLITVEDIGEKDTPKFIPKGTKVIFLKAIDNPADLSKSMVYIRHEKRGLVVPELSVAPLDKKKSINALADFNNAFMKQNPELRIYHPNFFIRMYFRLFYWVKKVINEKNKS